MGILLVGIITILLMCLYSMLKRKRKEQVHKVKPKNNSYSTAYFFVTLLLILLLVFLPINKDGNVVNTITCAEHYDTPYGHGLFWFLLYTELALVIGMILNACTNNYIVKGVRILLNIIVLGLIGSIMLILDQSTFDIGVGAWLLMAISFIDLIFAIAMALPNRNNQES